MAKPNDFQKHIDAARERKKNEALANKILGKSSRRQSAPGNLKSNAGPSLASRVGVKKNRASLGPSTKTTTNKRNHTGDVNGEWTHDLHTSVNPPPFSSRITKPRHSVTAAKPTKTTKPAATANSKKKIAARRAAAIDRIDSDPKVRQQVSVRTSNSAPATRSTSSGSSGEEKGSGGDISIRGIAGPFAVLAQNFAPGTTAADIESAMTPIGGPMESCHIIKSKPFILVEMVFATREGGEAVINTFNNKTADGRLLKVYPKVGGNPTSTTTAPPSGPKAMLNRDHLVDGSMGFRDPLLDSYNYYNEYNEYSNDSSNLNNNNSGNDGGNRLYSDSMLEAYKAGGNSWRGRTNQGYRAGGRR